MNIRRVLLTTAILSLTGPALAQAGQERSKTVLQHVDYPGNGFATEIVRVEVPAGARAPLHRHPGLRERLRH